MRRVLQNTSFQWKKAEKNAVEELENIFQTTPPGVNGKFLESFSQEKAKLQQAFSMELADLIQAEKGKGEPSKLWCDRSVVFFT